MLKWLWMENENGYGTCSIHLMIANFKLVQHFPLKSPFVCLSRAELNGTIK